MHIVQFLRHLQNLDAGSKATPGIDQAKQTTDIDAGILRNWKGQQLSAARECQGAPYEFIPIANSNLTSYTVNDIAFGEYYKISSLKTYVDDNKFSNGLSARPHYGDWKPSS